MFAGVDEDFLAAAPACVEPGVGWVVEGELGWAGGGDGGGGEAGGEGDGGDDDAGERAYLAGDDEAQEDAGGVGVGGWV